MILFPRRGRVMFGFGREKREATEVAAAAARMAIMPFWIPWDQAFDERIWKDAYVLGLIGGSISVQTHPITGRKLSTTDKGFVVLNAMRSLGAPQEASDLGLALAQSHDPDYARGYDDGVVTFLLMANAVKPEAYNEPEIVAAKEFVPAMRRLNAEAALAGVGGPQDPNQELAVAYIYLKVQTHKKAHYPKLD